MPNPKRRHSKTRRDQRRTHYRAIPSTTTVCPQCGSVKLSHRVCSVCGYYKGRKILAVT